MKTVINAKIIIETDQYQGVCFTGDTAVEMLTMQKIADIIRSGKFEILEVLRNDLMNDQEIILVIKQVGKV